jgi:2-dehydropantoate 2-reductase
MTIPHIHVLGGSGSLGLLFAAAMARVGHGPSCSITLLLRQEALAAFNARAAPDGTATITVQQPTIEGGGVLTAQVRAEPADAVAAAATATGGAATATKIDHLLIATKAPAVAPALRALAPRLTSRSVALLLCNGVLAVRDELLSMRQEKQLPPLGRLLVSSVSHGAFRPPNQPPFTVVHAGVGECVVGDLGDGDDCDGSSSSEMPELARVLQAAGPVLGARWEPECARVKRVLTTKLVTNCAANAPAGLLRCRNGAMLPTANNQAATELHEAVVRECVAALNLREKDDEDDEAAVARLQKAVVALLTGTRGNVNSLLQDVLAGRATEIEYLNGWVVRQAAKQGVGAPVNATLARLVRMAEGVAAEQRVP